MSEARTESETSWTRLSLPRMASDWRQYAVYIAFVVIFCAFAITQHDSGFLNRDNLLNIISQTATITIMAVAVTFVIGAAEIDLSVGAVAGFASVCAAMAIGEWGFLAGVVCGLAAGAGVGLVNGLLVSRAGIPSFLVTLGMMGIVTGTAQWMTNTYPVPIVDDTFNSIFGSGFVAGIPALVIWSAVALVVGHVFLRKTRFGRQVLATGGNEAAATFSGVHTRNIKLAVLVMSGFAAGVAGLLYAGRLESGRFQWGQGDELSVIAAVILGGTSLFGGRASVVGAVMGSLLINLINNGLLIMGLDYSQQQIVRGAIIVGAVALTRRAGA